MEELRGEVEERRGAPAVPSSSTAATRAADVAAELLTICWGDMDVRWLNGWMVDWLRHEADAGCSNVS